MYERAQSLRTPVPVLLRRYAWALTAIADSEDYVAGRGRVQQCEVDHDSRWASEAAGA